MIMIFCKIKAKNEQFKDMPQNISQNIISRQIAFVYMQKGVAKL